MELPIELPIGPCYFLVGEQHLLFPCGRTAPATFGLAWGARVLGPDRFGFGLGGPGPGPDRFGFGLGGQGPGPDRLGFGLGGQGPGPDRLILLIHLTVIRMLI